MRGPGWAASPLHGEGWEGHARGCHAHKASLWAPGPGPRLSALGRVPKPALPVASLKGGSPGLAVWEQFQNFRHLEIKQLRRQATPEPPPLTSPSDQGLTKPGAQETCRRLQRDLRKRKTFLASTSNGHPLQTLKATTFFSFAICLCFWVSRGLAGLEIEVHSVRSFTLQIFAEHLPGARQGGGPSAPSSSSSSCVSEQIRETRDFMELVPSAGRQKRSKERIQK